MSETVIRGVDAIFIDGPCPFLTCLETGPHGHDVCPDCRAVKFGNLSCDTCRSRWECPEAILLDSERVMRCAKQGSHEGEHRTAPFNYGDHEGVTATWSIPVDDTAIPPF